MTTLPKISVVVPSYNQGHFLRDTLESIFSQDYPNLEVVVMDGGSTDDSVSIIREYASRLHHWQSEKDDGQSAAINGGAARCTGDLVAWLNSDDFYWNDSLWTVARAYVRYPHRGMYIGNCLRYEQETGEFLTYCDRHMAHSRHDLAHWTNTVPQPSTFFLRDAWERVGGLRPELHYVMDWDIFIRISKRYPVVTINEFLAVAREYDDTKTRSGKITRAMEILRMIREHTGEELTPGSLHYLLEAIQAAAPDEMRYEVNELLNEGKDVPCRWYVHGTGAGYISPERNDAQDQVYLPITNDAVPQRIFSQATPTVSIVIPSLNRKFDLQKTIQSIAGQQDPNVECIVIDGGSTDGTVDWLRENEHLVSHWDSQKDGGPASAINRGVAKANGDVLAWLNPGDMLMPGALYEIRRAFHEDPAIDAVHGNAVFLDENDELHLVHRGTWRTGFWRSEWTALVTNQPEEMRICDWPQPTLFFRRQLWDCVGGLNETFRYVYDLDWRWRWDRSVKVKKIERTQALVRIRETPNRIQESAYWDDLYSWMLDQWGPQNESYRERFHFGTFQHFASYRLHWPKATFETWNAILQHRYHRDRRRWPRRCSSAFLSVWRRYVAVYMARKFPESKVGLSRWWHKLCVAVSALTHFGNPEKWHRDWIAKKSPLAAKRKESPASVSRAA